MKSSIQISVFAFAALCAAQAGFMNLPGCAKPCASSLPANCHLDVKCICSDKSWISGISCCVRNSCPESDQQKTLQVATQLCDTVDVELPQSASCPSDATSAASGGQSSAASAASAATNVASSAIAGAQATKSSVTSNVSNNAESATSAAGNAVNSATGSPTSSNPTSSASGEASTGAAQVFGSNIGVIGAAVAAFALL